MLNVISHINHRIYKVIRINESEEEMDAHEYRKFLAKIFEGPGFNEFWNDFRKVFKGSKVFRPEAIREGSREIYIMGIKP
jgi:23S rRNA U2552 (ribose-2'-O)-methylase RlmE/FtsJ